MAAGGHTSGDAVTGVTISFTIVATLCTILRLYTRFGLNRLGGVDDVFIAIATVSSMRQHSRAALTCLIAAGNSTNDYNVRTRSVSSTLNAVWRERELTRSSQVWYGKPSSFTHSS